MVNLRNRAGKHHSEGPRGKRHFVKVERYPGVDFPHLKIFSDAVISIVSQSVDAEDPSGQNV